MTESAWTPQRKARYAITIAFSIVLIMLISFVVIFLIIWGALGAYAFDQFYKANPLDGAGCKTNRQTQHPSNLKALNLPCGYETENTTALWDSLSLPLSNWTYVTFPARPDASNSAVDNNLQLKGILMIRDVQKSPFIIMVHGIRACKEVGNVMIPGAMMWRNGYNVLLIDLRNHGESQLSTKYKYASFGNQEFRDVLGGLDYLTSTYPRLQNTTDQVGLLGASMGGAVTAIAFAQQTTINSLWLDAPALSVRQTLFYNVQNAKFDADFIFNAVTARASYAWPWGMPPFPNDPLKALSSTMYSNATRHVFFTHKLDDTFVPMFNSEQGMQLMTAIGYNVTSYFASDPNQNPRCNHHVDMYAYDPAGYERRMVAFFGDHLKFL